MPPSTDTHHAAGAHFLPVDLDRLLVDLLEVVGGPEQRAAFERLGKIWVALFHLRMRADLVQLRRLYRPFDPDLEVLPVEPSPSPEQRRDAKQELECRARLLLDRAHFIEATREDLDRALTKTSPLGLAVSVDLDELERFALYYRGARKHTSRKRDPRSLWLRWRDEEMTVFRRVVLLIEARQDDRAVGRAKPDDAPPDDEDRDGEDLEGGLDPEHIYLKLFKDVPLSDLEMLLPNTRIRMTGLDKIRIGLTGGGGTVGGVMATVTKLGAAASPVTWVIALGGLGAVLWRQLAKVFTQRTKYMATLAQRLYFHTLDNGFGVLTRLVELAEEEECKEALLAAAFLVREGELSAEELDRTAEAWIQSTYGVPVDYDVAGGVAKLRDAGLLNDGDHGLVMIPFADAYTRLDSIWDGVFGGEASVSGS